MFPRGNQPPWDPVHPALLGMGGPYFDQLVQEERALILQQLIHADAMSLPLNVIGHQPAIPNPVVHNPLNPVLLRGFQQGPTFPVPAPAVSPVPPPAPSLAPVRVPASLPARFPLNHNEARNPPSRPTAARRRAETPELICISPSRASPELIALAERRSVRTPPAPYRPDSPTSPTFDEPGPSWAGRNLRVEPVTLRNEERLPPVVPPPPRLRDSPPVDDVPRNQFKDEKMFKLLKSRISIPQRSISPVEPDELDDDSSSPILPLIFQKEQRFEQFWKQGKPGAIIVCETRDEMKDDGLWVRVVGWKPNGVYTILWDWEFEGFIVKTHLSREFLSQPISRRLLFCELRSQNVRFSQIVQLTTIRIRSEEPIGYVPFEILPEVQHGLRLDLMDGPKLNYQTHLMSQPKFQNPGDLENLRKSMQLPRFACGTLKAPEFGSYGAKAALAVDRAKQDADKVRRDTALGAAQAKAAAVQKFINAGQAAGAAGHYREARDAFTEAIKLDPTNSKTFIARGLILQELKEFDEAIKDMWEGVNLDQKNVAARGFLSKAMVAYGDQISARGQKELAGKLYEGALSVFPQNEDAKERIRELHTSSGSTAARDQPQTSAPEESAQPRAASSVTSADSMGSKFVNSFRSVPPSNDTEVISSPETIYTPPRPTPTVAPSNSDIGAVMSFISSLPAPPTFHPVPAPPPMFGAVPVPVPVPGPPAWIPRGQAVRDFDFSALPPPPHLPAFPPPVDLHQEAWKSMTDKFLDNNEMGRGHDRRRKRRNHSRSRSRSPVLIERGRVWSPPRRSHRGRRSRSRSSERRHPDRRRSPPRRRTRSPERRRRSPPPKRRHSRSRSRSLEKRRRQRTPSPSPGSSRRDRGREERSREREVSDVGEGRTVMVTGKDIRGRGEGNGNLEDASSSWDRDSPEPGVSVPPVDLLKSLKVVVPGVGRSRSGSPRRVESVPVDSTVRVNLDKEKFDIFQIIRRQEVVSVSRTVDFSGENGETDELLQLAKKRDIAPGDARHRLNAIREKTQDKLRKEDPVAHAFIVAETVENPAGPSGDGAISLRRGKSERVPIQPPSPGPPELPDDDARLKLFEKRRADGSESARRGRSRSLEKPERDGSRETSSRDRTKERYQREERDRSRDRRRRSERDSRETSTKSKSPSREDKFHRSSRVGRLRGNSRSRSRSRDRDRNRDRNGDRRLQIDSQDNATIRVEVRNRNNAREIDGRDASASSSDRRRDGGKSSTRSPSRDRHRNERSRRSPVPDSSKKPEVSSSDLRLLESVLDELSGFENVWNQTGS